MLASREREIPPAREAVKERTNIADSENLCCCWTAPLYDITSRVWHYRLINNSIITNSSGETGCCWCAVLFSFIFVVFVILFSTLRFDFELIAECRYHVEFVGPIFCYWLLLCLWHVSFVSSYRWNSHTHTDRTDIVMQLLQVTNAIQLKLISLWFVWESDWNYTIIPIQHYIIIK